MILSVLKIVIYYLSLDIRKAKWYKKLPMLFLTPILFLHSVCLYFKYKKEASIAAYTFWKLVLIAKKTGKKTYIYVV